MRHRHGLPRLSSRRSILAAGIAGSGAGSLIRGVSDGRVLHYQGCLPIVACCPRNSPPMGARWLVPETCTLFASHSEILPSRRRLSSRLNVVTGLFLPPLPED